MSNNKDMGLAPLIYIRETLNKLFGEGDDSWSGWEMETISDLLKVGFDELTRDKIHILQVLKKEPTLFLDDMAFFLHATKAINNNPADFEYLPMPSCLELAYAITQFQKLSGATIRDLQGAADLTDCVAYLLTEDGLSEPLKPFDFIPKDMLTEGQTPMDTANKARAIELYITHMDSL